jgi:hypothetical protein
MLTEMPIKASLATAFVVSGVDKTKRHIMKNFALNSSNSTPYVRVQPAHWRQTITTLEARRKELEASVQEAKNLDRLLPQLHLAIAQWTRDSMKNSDEGESGCLAVK